MLPVRVGPGYASVGSVLPDCRAEHGCIGVPIECSCLRFGAEVGEVLEVGHLARVSGTCGYVFLGLLFRLKSVDGWTLQLRDEEEGWDNERIVDAL